ncbi:RNA-binding protein Musashi homolog 2-like [Pocillopora damicornis]|uniref:RNA-binding protein Musashi homolog 2-like n=1 Tax=Pocillopora damicornis TaxID=46731 RepID=UPI000F54FFD8|nr:RNA-binding protein Musashi homolog 2-like [Pocillopora damicornis]
MLNTKMVRGTSKGDDIGKIFVGGLSTETTKESLQEYFSDFGEVTDCIVMRDTATKRSRGFGFVTFQDPASVDSVCQKAEHILDNKKVDPKRAVPRGPGQQEMISTQSPGGQSRDAGNNENKIFVGGLSSNTTEDDLRRFFSAIGKVVHVKLMYDKENSRMRGFGFVTFESSEAVEEACRIHYHDINGKTVEAKKAEQRDSRMGPGGSMGMGGAQMNSGYNSAQYYPQMQGQFGGPPPVPGMGRGYPGYSAIPQGYPGAPNMVTPGYGYGGYDQTSMYGAQTSVATPGYGNYSAVPSSAASMAATSGGYPDYSQMSAATPQAGMPATTPGGQPRLETPATTDYSVYGLGNYPQQESNYGPARTSFSSDSGYSGFAGNAEQPGYGPGPYGGGESLGRGGNVSRGFHPYGR